MSNWELAYKDYKDGMKYKDIADKYGVSINTVKSWRTRKWKELEAGTDAKSAHTTQKGAHTKQPKLVIDNDDLTEQQKMFCIYYVQSFNATKAYRQAYQCSWETANARAYLLLGNVGVKKELTRLKAELQQEVHIDTKDLINELARQVKADIKDYVEFGQEVATNEAGENYIKSFMRFKDMDEVDGTLIDSIKLGKDGVSVQLPSKQKAIDMLLKYIDTDAEADTHAKVINRGNDEMQEWLDDNT